LRHAFPVSISGVSTSKLAILLPLIHVAVAGILIGFEESRYWRLNLESIDRADRLERHEREQPRHTIQSKAAEDKDSRFSETMEFRSSAATRVIFGFELPAFLVLGWFRHPITSRFDGFLQPWLVGLTLGMPAASKLVCLDGILIVTIGAQWWVICWWLEQRAGKNKPIRFLRTLAIAISVAEAVSAICCLAGGELEVPAILAAFGAVFAWFAILLSAAAAAFKLVRNLLGTAIRQGGLS
jgi:hypothetical protein